MAHPGLRHVRHFAEFKNSIRILAQESKDFDAQGIAYGFGELNQLIGM
jgi:hypothetical protein